MKTTKIKMFIKLIRAGKISLLMPIKEMRDVVTMYSTYEYLKSKKYEEIIK